MNYEEIKVEIYDFTQYQLMVLCNICFRRPQIIPTKNDDDRMTIELVCHGEIILLFKADVGKFKMSVFKRQLDVTLRLKGFK